MKRFAATIALILGGCAVLKDPQAEQGPLVAWEAANGAYAASKRTQSQAEYTRAFVADFLDGFLHPDAQSWSYDPDDAGYRGYLAGQSYGRAHLEQRDALLIAFGYTRVESVGDYHRGFEVSTFYPENRDGVWWVDGLDATWPELPEPPPYRIASVRYRIAGYLSPKGKYGHLGQCSHLLLATRIEAEPATASQMKYLSRHD